VQSNDDVDVSALTIDPEEVKFQRLDLPVEEDLSSPREKQLGLIDLGPDAPRRHARSRRRRRLRRRARGEEGADAEAEVPTSVKDAAAPEGEEK